MHAGSARLGVVRCVSVWFGATRRGSVRRGFATFALLSRSSGGRPGYRPRSAPPPHPESPGSETITTARGHDPQSVHERLDHVTVVDVRTPGEFEAVHVPHAVNLPLAELAGRLDEVRQLVEEGGEVILSCRTENRARQARQQLVDAGLPELPILTGGIVGWQEAGTPVVREAIRWDLERQVRLVAGSIVLLSIVASIWFPPARFVAGFVGAGLVFAAVSNTCGMALLLAKLPYNRPRSD